jgi:hypothetical protein
MALSPAWPTGWFSPNFPHSTAEFVLSEVKFARFRHSMKNNLSPLMPATPNGGRSRESVVPVH